MRAILLCILGLCSFSNSVADQSPVLSLVIDDLGYSLQHGRAAIELQGEHTYAIIPGTHYGKKLALHADSLEKEVILHLPLQASNPDAASEPNVLHAAMDEVQIAKNLSEMLSEIPSIKGVNNHMGSLLTELDYFMRPIMDGIRAYNSNLYFLDSRTSPRSVAYYEALDSGLTSIRRDIFLDNDHTNTESIHFQYQLWLQKARERGHAVAIGHPHSNTIDYLQQQLPQTHKHFRFYSVSRLIQKKIADRKSGPSDDENQSLAQRAD